MAYSLLLPRGRIDGSALDSSGPSLGGLHRPYLGLAAASLYSASPMQLMSGGLGEASFSWPSGPMLSWVAHINVQTGKLSLLGRMVSLPLAFVITAIIWINEFPDLEAGISPVAKHHLVARLG